MPHMEARSEIDGLLFWNGDPTVFVLASDVELNAMLLEYCPPSISLRGRPEYEQDEVIGYGVLPLRGIHSVIYQK